MKELWGNLSQRDRRLLVLAGGLLLLFILFMIWSSLHTKVIRLQSLVHDQKVLDQWMQDSAAQLQRLRGAAGPQTGTVSTDKSLLALVDQTARQAGLGGAIKRVEPEQDNNVRVWFEQVAFDDMVRWLNGLGRSYAVRVDTISVERQDQPGRVNVRLVLKGGGAA